MSAAPQNYRIIESRCPTCDYKLDGATVAHGEDTLPSEGDASVCLNCGQVLVYQADLTVRKATATDVRKIMEEAPHAWETVEKAQRFIQQRGRFA